MPIANCVITENCQKQLKDGMKLIEIWASESSTLSEHMTVNFIPCLAQGGSQYDVMANLVLPSLWSQKDVKALQLGLAKALARFFNVDVSSVHVVTQIVDSGMVVENGEVVTW